MSALHIASAIRDLERAAALIVQAVAALSAWDPHYDGSNEQDAAHALYFKALSLRLLLETEKRERVLH